MSDTLELPCPHCGNHIILTPERVSVAVAGYTILGCRNCGRRYEAIPITDTNDATKRN